jgi:hypothetical protein
MRDRDLRPVKSSLLPWALAAAVLSVASPSVATPYESFIDIASEEDLEDLLSSEQISQDTFDTLLDLLSRGVDLNTADREELYGLPNLTYPEVDAILAYRTEQTRLTNPADLVAAGVLTEDKFVAIAAFLVKRDPSARPLAASGFVRAVTRTSPSDGNLPPTGLHARLQLGRHVTAGLASTITRLRLGAVTYDPNRGALMAEPEATRLHLAKAFVSYQSDKLAAIAGSYRAGFGQRLVFDNSSSYTPNGFFLDQQLTYTTDQTHLCKESSAEAPPVCTDRDQYVSPDFGWRDGLWGVALSAKHLSLGSGFIQAHAWGSVAPRSLYQYELANADCSDPRDDDAPGCASPTVYRKPDGDLLTPTSRYSFQTLPDVLSETLGGGNLTYFADRRNHFGITGYGASIRSLVKGIALDTQEWSRVPFGGGNGAVGADLALGRKWLDVAAEFAYSFDKITDGIGPSSGGGGPAAVVRATVTGAKKELELSFRYLDTDFVNPHARPVSADDEFEGQRARDEVGGRLRYTGSHGKVALRSALDLWTNPSVGAAKTDVFARADMKAGRRLSWGLSLRFQDKDLGDGGRGQCYEVTFEEDQLGEPVPCRGMRFTSAARVEVAPTRTLTFSAQTQHELLDDPRYLDKFRQDLSGWLMATYRPTARMSFRSRLRYRSDDISDGEHLEESLWAYLEATFTLRQRDRLRVRSDLFSYLDDRASTGLRAPNPAVWFWLDYEARFR